MSASQNSKLAEVCQKFFSSDRGDHFADNLDRLFPDGACECVSVSAHSPGPVGNTEVLISIVPTDQWIDENSMVKPVMADRSHTGLSACRRQYTSPAYVDALAHQLVQDRRASGREGSVVGVVGIDVDVVRSAMHGGRRLFTVYDTALLENPSHSEIFKTSYPEQGVQNRKAINATIRHEFLKALLFGQKAVSVEDAFSSF